MFVVLLLGEAEGKRLAGASRAAGLGVSQPAVAAALLGTVGKMESHAALGLEHSNKQGKFSQKVLNAIWEEGRPMANK